jgi:uncharacterized protein YbbC (DUF1343 family)
VLLIHYLRFPGEVFQGVQFHIENLHSFEPYTTGLFIMETRMDLYPDKDLFSKSETLQMFDKIVGNDNIRLDLEAGIPINQQKSNWKLSLENFKQIRKKYLLYK